jgi:hypothetical protein
MFDPFSADEEEESERSKPAFFSDGPGVSTGAGVEGGERVE